MFKLLNLLIISVPTVLFLVATVPAHAQESVDEDLKAGGRTIRGPGIFEATEGVKKRRDVGRLPEEHNDRVSKMHKW